MIIPFGFLKTSSVSVTERMTQDNAAAASDDNATASWSTTSATVTVNAVEFTDGVRSIQIEGTGNQSFSRGKLTLTIESGKTIDVFYDAKWNGVGTAANVKNSSGVTPDITEHDITTSFVSYSSLGHTSNDTTLLIQFYVSDDATNKVWIDNVRIEEY